MTPTIGERSLNRFAVAAILRWALTITASTTKATMAITAISHLSHRLKYSHEKNSETLSMIPYTVILITSEY